MRSFNGQEGLRSHPRPEGRGLPAAPSPLPRDKYEFAEDKPIIKRESLSECVLLNEEEAHEVIKRYFAGETP